MHSRYGPRATKFAVFFAKEHLQVTQCVQLHHTRTQDPSPSTAPNSKDKNERYTVRCTRIWRCQAQPLAGYGWKCELRVFVAASANVPGQCPVIVISKQFPTLKNCKFNVDELVASTPHSMHIHGLRSYTFLLFSVVHRGRVSSAKWTQDSCYALDYVIPPGLDALPSL